MSLYLELIRDNPWSLFVSNPPPPQDRIWDIFDLHFVLVENWEFCQVLEQFFLKVEIGRNQ